MMDIQYPKHLEQLTVRLDPRAEQILAGSNPNVQKSSAGLIAAALACGLVAGVLLILGYQSMTTHVQPLVAANDITPAITIPESLVGAETAPIIDANAEPTSFLQIATYAREQDALDVKQQLEESGLSNVIVVANLTGKPLYRVRIGPLQDPNNYAELSEKLRDAGFADTLLVRSLPPGAAIASAPEASGEIPDPVIPESRAAISAMSEVPVTAPSSVEVTRPWGTRSAATQLVLRAGLSAMRAGDLNAAEIKFRQVLIAEPDATQASSYLFTVLIDQGRVEAADAVAAAGLENGSDIGALAKLYARSLLNRGEAGSALRILEDHRAASSGDPEYAALLAALLQKAARHEEAAQIYEQLLTLDQQAGDWWVGLGIAQDGLGRPTEALQAFQRARETGTISAALADYSDRRIAELQQ